MENERKPDVDPQIIMGAVTKLAKVLNDRHMTDMEKIMASELLHSYMQSVFSAKMAAIAIQKNMGD